MDRPGRSRPLRVERPPGRNSLQVVSPLCDQNPGTRMKTTAAPRPLPWSGVVAAVIVTLAGSALADCPRTCGRDLVACKRTRCAGRHGGERQRCLADCRGATGCGGGINTVAWVVTTCHVQGTKVTG